LRVGAYVLKLLESVRQDDLNAFLGAAPGRYIAAHPEAQRMPIRKKYRVFEAMGPGSEWLSPNEIAAGPRNSRIPDGRPVRYLDAGRLHGRFGQLLQTVWLMAILVRDRRRYEYVLMYNFYLPVYLSALFAKLALGKRLMVEYEDDYTLVRSGRVKNAI